MNEVAEEAHRSLPPTRPLPLVEKRPRDHQQNGFCRRPTPPVGMGKRLRPTGGRNGVPPALDPAAWRQAWGADVEAATVSSNAGARAPARRARDGVAPSVPTAGGATAPPRRFPAAPRIPGGFTRVEVIDLQWRVRVGFVTDATTIGGSEVWLTEVLPRLGEFGIEPFSAMPEAGATEPVRRRLREMGVEARTYRRLSEVPAADLYVTSTWAPMSLRAFLRKLPGPVYSLLHDQIEIFYPLGLRYLYRLGYRAFQVPLLRRAKRVITVSDWARRWLTEVHGLPDVRSIHNGVDGERFRPPGADEKAELRRRFGFGGTVAVMPARFAPEKNHLAALLAVRGIPGLTLALAGAGPLESQMRAAARWLRVENVVFLGMVEDTARLYRAADLLLIPTFGENQSLVTLEAMASGLPVLSSDIPAQRELIDDGVEGWLAPPWPPRHLRRRLLEALADEEELRRAGERARRRVLARHTLPGVASSLAAVLREFASP